jgi:hypothetical protein
MEVLDETLRRKHVIVHSTSFKRYFDWEPAAPQSLVPLLSPKDHSVVSRMDVRPMVPNNGLNYRAPEIARK